MKEEGRRVHEIDLLAIIIAGLCCVLAYSSRYTLNPDGVSYLDLGEALGRGQWSAYVQGYWSPLYPALIALAARLTGTSGPALLPVVHALNALIAIAVIAIIWQWARPLNNPFFGRAALAAFLVSSARPPRVEAVTPDLLLLACAVWLAYELLVHGGRRWLLVGVILGLMFLSKTSSWPWLLLAFGVRWWGAVDSNARRLVMLSTSASVAVMLLWVVPLTLQAGHPTLGSAGRLNFCWYLKSCDSQTPDSHAGGHKNYQVIHVGEGPDVMVARFDAASPWTYAPWGDPTAWDRGVQTRSEATPSVTALVAYWGSLTLNVVGIWMAQLLLLVLAPMLWAARRPGLWAELQQMHRDAGVVIALGVLGIAEFIVVHAEPRLIAPFAMLLALGALTWFGDGPLRIIRKPKATAPLPSRGMWQICSWVGLISAVGVMLIRLQEGFDSDQRITTGIEMMQQAKASIANGGALGTRLVVIGPAMPMVANAFLMDWRIVAQVRPPSVQAIVTLAPDQMQRRINELFRGIADVAWVATSDQQFQFVRIDTK